MAIRNILNIASVQQEEEEALKAQSDYQSGLFGMTAQELKKAKREETMDMLRFGQSLGLSGGQIGVGMLLGQAARKLTGKEDSRELELEQREVNRAAFLEQLKGASNQELIDLGTKAMLSEDDETRSFGYQLFGAGRSGIAAELAAAKKAGERSVKNVSEQDVLMANRRLKDRGYKLIDDGVGALIAQEYREREEDLGDTQAWKDATAITRYDQIIADLEESNQLKRDEGNVLQLFADKATTTEQDTSQIDAITETNAVARDYAKQYLGR